MKSGEGKNTWFRSNYVVGDVMPFREYSSYVAALMTVRHFYTLNVRVSIVIRNTLTTWLLWRRSMSAEVFVRMVRVVFELHNIQGYSSLHA